LFDRVREAYDLGRLAASRVICIGVGGSGLFLEQLARAGVGDFVLIDPDTYSPPNVATQHCYLNELGRPKVECVSERLRRINPRASIVAHQARLEDFDDDAFKAFLAQEPTPAVNLICACTDSFPAQARANLLALKFSTPLLASQVYERGLAAELVWSHPELSHACARCICGSRYRAQAKGTVKPVTSHGAPIYMTIRLNAAETFLAFALLHHGSSHPRWGNLLERLGNRQLVQLRGHPDAEGILGLSNFSQAFAGAASTMLFSDEAIWRPQQPEHPDTGYAEPCPDCGGSGDLRLLKGITSDTLKLQPYTKP
jgi:hypothetical protein